jgi:hypothetical protein
VGDPVLGAQHWNGFLRERWLEHLQGRTFWIELDHDDFGLLQRTFQDSALLDEILERLKDGRRTWTSSAGPTTSICRWIESSTSSKCSTSTVAGSNFLFGSRLSQAS